jgi:hypothetical protein
VLCCALLSQPLPVLVHSGIQEQLLGANTAAKLEWHHGITHTKGQILILWQMVWRNETDECLLLSFDCLFVTWR